MSGNSTTIDDVAERSASGTSPHGPRATVAAPRESARDHGPATHEGFAARLDEALAATQAALNEHLTRGAARASAGGRPVADLWTDLADQVGGKLVRPRLTLAAYLGLGGRDLGDVAPVAAAQELLHTAMLVHDDLLDHDETRRGRSNLAGATRSRFAEAGIDDSRADVHVQAAALLGGDLAIAGAFELVLGSTAGPGEKLAVAGQLVRAVQVAVAGEVLDVSGPLLAPSDVDPELVAELKTATYTCVVPLRSGAILAGADAATCALLETYGRALGVAFQLVDDLLGVFGDPRVTGKSTVSDLREGKRTLLLACAYRGAEPADVALLDQHVGRADLTDAGAAVVRAVMRRTAAPEAVRATVTRHLDEARAAAAELPAPLGPYLLDLADSFADRAA
ncbi:polyprenyl synthetase family protein [Oerskovia enterophila]|uniref:polyprenyl synthetase family protein n=1 Tax=Oerskovia enterophila TaxID=43678 RepID=UPI00380CDAFE